MMMKKKTRRLLAAGPIALFAAAMTFADDFGLSRSSIDGGGVMHSSGADFELSGTIGQPDAGIVMTGGVFEATGGFWFPLDDGDCDEDGLVSLFDYIELDVCFTGPEGDVGEAPCPCLDLDLDGDVDLIDFGAFQSSFNGG